MSALLKRVCCCETNPAGWYTCKPVYCADAFSNEGFPALQDDAQFMTYLSEAKIQGFIDQGFFPNGNEAYWHDGVQLWVLDDSSDFLGDASSPQNLDPPIFAPPAPNGRFKVVSPPNTPLDRAPPPLFSFTEEFENFQGRKFLRITHLGTALFTEAGTDVNNAGFTVTMNPDPGPSSTAGPTNYAYSTYYRPTFAMANDLPTVTSKGLPVEMDRIIYEDDPDVVQKLECIGEQESGEVSAPVQLGAFGGMFYGPSTLEGIYGTGETYIHPLHVLDLVMVSTEVISLEEQCDGTFDEPSPPYFFSFFQGEVPDDQGVFQGLIYQNLGAFLPCEEPFFDPVESCPEDNIFLQNGTTGFGQKARLLAVHPHNGRMNISAGLCSLFGAFPPADGYVKTQGGRDFPNPIDGLGVYFMGVGISELASDFRDEATGTDDGEEFLIKSGNGLTILQPVSIQ